MKAFLALALLAVLVGAIVWWLRTRPTEAEQRPSSADMMRELREQVLHGTAAEFSIQPVSTVWGVLMETGHEQAVVTLVVLADGNASLYFSNGGGVLGGGQTPSINAAARRVVSMAVRFLPALTPTADFPVPAFGRTRFYALTTNGVMTLEALENDLGYNQHALSPLFHACHEVIAGFRPSLERL